MSDVYICIILLYNVVCVRGGWLVGWMDGESYYCVGRNVGLFVVLASKHVVFGYMKLHFYVYSKGRETLGKCGIEYLAWHWGAILLDYYSSKRKPKCYILGLASLDEARERFWGTV